MSSPQSLSGDRVRRNTALVLAGQAVTLLGDYVALLALPLFVYELTGSSLYLGLTTAFETLPTLLFGFAVGVALDRIPMKRALVIADLGRAVELGGPTHFYLSYLAVAHARAGNPSKAREILAGFEKRTSRGAALSSWRARIHAALGERDEALDALESAYEEHDRSLFHVASDPLFDEVRSHPRFTALFRRMGLEKWC